MTSAINYEEFHSTVETDLRSLLAEKEQLQEQFQNIEQRLAVISLHEEKLRRVRDSLAALLAVNPVADSTPGEMELNTANAAENLNTAETSIGEVSEPTVEQAAATAASTNLEPKSPELLLQSSEPENSSETASSSVAAAAAEQGVASLATPSSIGDAAVLTNSASEAPILQIADFAPEDFFERFPHISKTHPVHVLARKLLEYFGSGLRLAEIARLIEQLGYRHNSRNFTDSVHSALKNKRKATGEFRFNAQKSVWELSHWHSNNVAAGNAPETEEAKEITAEASREPTPTVLTEQVERAVAKQLSKAKNRSHQAPPKKNLKAGIKVYKARK